MSAPCVLAMEGAAKMQHSDGLAEPSVSIVTITRNNLGGLEATRASVLAQTYRAVEHIVVDAASVDGTRAWLTAQSDDVAWISEPDGGRYDGMNKGTHMSSGDLVWFMHAGDTFAGPAVVDMVARDWMQRRWRWMYGGARLRGAEGKLVGVNAPVPFRLRRFALGETVLPHQAACFELSLVHELGGYDTEFGLAADQLFMLRAALLSAPATMAEFLCDFDTSGAGCSRHGFWHYWDSARTRRKTGTLVKGGIAADTLVTFTFTGYAMLKASVGKRLEDRQ